jgi:hypothetical protein
MSCSTCGSAGSCGCSSVTIPAGINGKDGINGINGVSPTVIVEPPGAHCANGGVKITDSSGNVTYLCSGASGLSGATMCKYANTFTVGVIPVDPGLGVGLGVLSVETISITKAAIISCNPLLSTCVSTPLDLDFVINIWKQNGLQWLNVTANASYISSIKYDTSGNTLLITPSAAGTFRVVIIG